MKAIRRPKPVEVIHITKYTNVDQIGSFFNENDQYEIVSDGLSFKTSIGTMKLGVNETGYIVREENRDLMGFDEDSFNDEYEVVE